MDEEQENRSSEDPPQTSDVPGKGTVGSAISGASAGAVIGTMIGGPAGTVAGSIVGGIFGGLLRPKAQAPVRPDELDKPVKSGKGDEE